MRKKLNLSYRQIQRIKAQEFERFFAHLPEYSPYMNHLGEIHWMAEKEAMKQHEFYLVDESIFARWNRQFRLKKEVHLDKLPESERELRLRIRQYLELRYLGELTPETAELLPQTWAHEIDDEDIENIPISLDLFKISNRKKILGFVGLLVVLGVAGYFWLGNQEKVETGKLMVRSNISGARVYLDETDFIGYSNKLIINIPVGNYKISAVKEGYVSLPKYHEIEIMPDSIITLDFKFKTSRTEMLGYLKVQTDQDNSKIFINNEFRGTIDNNTVLSLEEGTYAINIHKEGFVTRPTEKVVSISPGDTASLAVQQTPISESRRSRRSRTETGSIEVVSNVKNAKIYLNGKDSGQETDYVFTQMPLGDYKISIEKEGYAINPDEVRITIDPEDQTGSARFTLHRKFEHVSIMTKPPEGRIYVDGEFKAEGHYDGMLDVGKHEITFGELQGYNAPAPQTIMVRPGPPVSVEAKYFPKFMITAEVDKDGNVIKKDCDVKMGYTFSNQSFTPSDEGGPSIEFNEKIKQYLWKLGYAFPFRNPKGNDAILVTFELPRDLDYRQKFKVRLLSAASHDKYPLSISTKVDVTIKFNNAVLSYYYEPNFLEQLGGLEVTEWEVTSDIRPGPNNVLVTTTDNNNVFYYIKKIEIFN
jgi:hypothetical protein